jgi:hypothetical protein
LNKTEPVKPYSDTTLVGEITDEVIGSVARGSKNYCLAVYR